MTGLPVIGYMEQTVSSTLTEALVACGKLKPKFPYQSIEASAVEFLGLYLKGILLSLYLIWLISLANNPKVKPWIRDNYKRKLDKFELQCQNLNFLTNNMLKSRLRNKWEAYRDAPTIQKVESIIEQRNEHFKL